MERANLKVKLGEKKLCRSWWTGLRVWLVETWRRLWLSIRNQIRSRHGSTATSQDSRCKEDSTLQWDYDEHRNITKQMKFPNHRSPRRFVSRGRTMSPNSSVHSNLSSLSHFSMSSRRPENWNFWSIAALDYDNLENHKQIRLTCLAAQQAEPTPQTRGHWVYCAPTR